jgi:hypothetical protein
MLLMGDDQPASVRTCMVACSTYGIPNPHRVGQQAQATGLVYDFLVVAGAKLASVGEEQPARQGVTHLAAIKLELDPAPELFLVEVAQEVDGLDDTPQGRDRLGHATRRRGVGQPLEHDMNASHPVAQGDRHSH